jgi:hypothetical protein
MQLLPKQRIAGRYGYNCCSYIVFSGITATVTLRYLYGKSCESLVIQVITSVVNKTGRPALKIFY